MIVMTTIISGRVVPRGIVPFRRVRTQHTISRSNDRNRANAIDIILPPQFTSLIEEGTPMPRAAGVLAFALICTACPASRADVAMSEQIIQLGDGLNDLRQDNAVLQQQVDSLRLVVAKQDTVIRQLANLAGVLLSR